MENHRLNNGNQVRSQTFVSTVVHISPVLTVEFLAKGSPRSRLIRPFEGSAAKGAVCSGEETQILCGSIPGAIFIGLLLVLETRAI